MWRECRHPVCGQRAGCQGVVGVQGRAVLVVSVSRDGRVEAGPEHPQVDGTWDQRRPGQISFTKRLQWFIWGRRVGLREGHMTRAGPLTNHSKQVRMVHWAVLVFALVQVGSVQDSGHHEAKVGSEGVDGHGASGILSLNQKVSHDSSEKSPSEGFSGRYRSFWKSHPEQR